MNLLNKIVFTSRKKIRFLSQLDEKERELNAQKLETRKVEKEAKKVVRRLRSQAGLDDDDDGVTPRKRSIPDTADGVKSVGSRIAEMEARCASKKYRL